MGKKAELDQRPDDVYQMERAGSAWTTPAGGSAPTTRAGHPADCGPAAGQINFAGAPGAMAGALNFRH